MAYVMAAASWLASHSEQPDERDASELLLAASQALAKAKVMGQRLLAQSQGPRGVSIDKCSIFCLLLVIAWTQRHSQLQLEISSFKGFVAQSLYHCR